MVIIDWLNNNSGASQVILTTALVCVTGWYTILTRRTLSILENQIDTGIRPFLAIDHFHVPDTPNKENTYCIYSNLKNIGSGVALNILVEFKELRHGDFVGKSVNSIDFLVPEGNPSSHHIHIDKDAFQRLRYAETHHGLAAELICVMHFEDMRGRKYKTQQMVFFTKTDRKITPEPGTLRLVED